MVPHTQQHIPSFSTLIIIFQQLTTELSLCFVFLCVSLSFFFTFSHTIASSRWTALNYIFIYSLYFFSLIPRAYSHLSPTRASCLPSWYTVSRSRRNYLCRSFSRLFLFFVPLYSTPLNKLEIFKKRTFCSFFPMIIFILTIKTGSKRPLSLRLSSFSRVECIAFIYSSYLII